MREGITKVGIRCFEFCGNLLTVKLQTTIQTIDTEVFYGCSKLLTVEIPAADTIGFGAFQSCSKLTTIKLPQELKYLGGSAFQYCSRLQEIVLPDSITVLNSFVFRGCDQLSSIKLPHSLKKISQSALNECNLAVLILPDSLERIENYAFQFNEFESIVFPAKVDFSDPTDGSEKSTYLLGKCKNLRSVCCLNPVATMASAGTTFGNLPHGTTLYVPVGSKQSYIDAGYGDYTEVDAEWAKNFEYIQDFYEVKIAPMQHGTVSIPGNPYSLSGDKVSLECVPDEGYQLDTLYVLDAYGEEVQIIDTYSFEIPFSPVTVHAVFVPKQYEIVVESNDVQMGSVVGSGFYDYDAEVTLEAIPNAGYEFVKWSDEVTTATRIVVVSGSATYTAIFALKMFTITTMVENYEQGVAFGRGSYQEGTEVTLIAVPNTGYVFTKWLDDYYQEYTDARLKIIVTRDATYQAFFEAEKHTTSLESVQNEASLVQKVFENNTIYIFRDGKKYTVDGIRVL